MTTPSGATAMVANPMHTALSNLYSRLQQDAAAMSDALKPADQQMAAGQTWVGPTGQSWGDQLNGYSRDCANQVNAMLADVAQALRNEPAQVTPEVAQMKTRMMILMERNDY